MKVRARKTIAQQRAEDARRRARPDLAEQQDRSGHGRNYTYNHWFCRCRLCTNASNKRMADYRARMAAARQANESELADRWARGEDV